MKLVSKEPPRDQKYTIEASYGELYELKRMFELSCFYRNIRYDDSQNYSTYLEIEKILKSN